MSRQHNMTVHEISGSTASLIDIRPQGRFFGILLGGALLLVMVPFSIWVSDAVRGANYQTNPALLVLICFGVPGVPILSLHLLIYRFVQNLSGTFEERIRASSERFFNTPATAYTLQERARRGDVGHTVRMIPENWEAPDPFKIPFEPVELRKNNPSLVQLHTHSSEAGSPQPRRHKRNYAVWAMNGAMLLYFGWLTITASLNFPLWKVAGFGLSYGVIIALSAMKVNNRRWLVVPSGILIQESGLWRENWKSKLYTRDTVNLLVNKFGGYWTVTLHDRKKSIRFRRQLTDAEVDFLLRAWLSPLPVPEYIRNDAGTDTDA